MKQKQKNNLALYFITFILILFSINAVELPVDLGTSGNFVILTKSGVSTTGTTSIVGNIGASPIDSTAITGFSLILDPSTQFATSSLITGNVYASDYAEPTPSQLTLAISDMETAYTDAAGRTIPDFTELGAGNIGGLTLTPGLYKWGTGVTIPTDVTILGNSTDVWIFQIAQTLDLSNGKQILLSGGALPENIFWQVGAQTTIGTTAVFNGNILSQTAIVLNNGATLTGRALAQTAVTLDANTITGLSAAPVLTIINISQNEINLTLGNIAQLNLTKLDQFNLPISAIINYSSSNTSVVTVNSSGSIIAIGYGNAIITAQNGSINDTINITVPTPFPILNNIGSKTIIQNNTLYFIITATSSDGLPLTFNLSGKPANATFIDYGNNSASFTWMPNSTDVGFVNVNFSVSNGYNNDSELISIRVNLSPPPVTTIINPGNLGSNVDFNVTLNATGTNSTIAYINYTLNGVFGQITNGTGNILINSTGNNTIIYYAVDSFGNVEQNVTINAILDKTSANITSFTLSSSSVYTGDIITGTCLATDNLDNNPEIVISGIDTSNTGTKTAICTVTDASGNINTSSLNYTVNQRSSGGGGGGSTYHLQTEQSISKNIPNMIQGLNYVYINKNDIAITNMKILTLDNAKNVRITTTQLNGKPSGVQDPKINDVYLYLQIEHTNLNNSIIENVKIQFKVEKVWMVNNKLNTYQINLYRYTTDWNLVETKMISEDSTYYYFESNSHGLSYFVIGSTQTQTNTPTPTTVTVINTPITPVTTPTPTTVTVINTPITPPITPVGLDNIVQTTQNLNTSQTSNENNLFSAWTMRLGLLLLLLLIIGIILLMSKKPKNKKEIILDGAIVSNTKSHPFSDDSIYPIKKLEGIGPEYEKALLSIGIENTKQLWEVNANKAAEKTGASINSIKSWQNMAELCCIKDIGPQYSELLERSGVHSIKQLKNYNPDTLLKLVLEKEKSIKINIQGNTPSHNLVKNWIEQARKHKFTISK